MPPPADVPPIASDPPPSASSPSALPPGPPPSITELFLAFSNMALHGFGGVLPWARRAIVEEKRWMTAQEFNEAFSIGQFLPGANIVNLCGRVRLAAARCRRAPSWRSLGLLIPPVAIVLVLAMLYGRYGDIEALQRILAGVAAAAAGLLGATAVKMTQPLLREGIGALAVMAAAFVAIGVMRWPLPWVLLVLAPVSIGIAAGGCGDEARRHAAHARRPVRDPVAVRGRRRHGGGPRDAPPGGRCVSAG